MFRMSEETEKKLGFRNRTRRSRKDSAARRQKVYAYIIKNTDKAMSSKELAEAAGFDMSCSTSDSYQKGANFIYSMKMAGHIESQDDRYNPDPKGPKLWYVTTKENVECSLYTNPTIKEEKHEEIEEPRETILDDTNTDSVNNSNTLFNFSIHVSKGYDTVDLEIDDLSKEEIVEKVKKLLELL